MGEGYHTFRGPRPIAWDQIYSDANWECCKVVHRQYGKSKEVYFQEMKQSVFLLIYVINKFLIW